MFDAKKYTFWMAQPFFTEGTPGLGADRSDPHADPEAASGRSGAASIEWRLDHQEIADLATISWGSMARFFFQETLGIQPPSNATFFSVNIWHLTNKDIFFA